jgi:hypothetical protein
MSHVEATGSGTWFLRTPMTCLHCRLKCAGRCNCTTARSTILIARRILQPHFVYNDKMSMTHPSTKKAPTRALPFREFISFLRPLAAGSGTTAAGSPYLLAEPKCGKTRIPSHRWSVSHCKTHGQQSLLPSLRSFLSLLHGPYPTQREKERSSRSAVSFAFAIPFTATVTLGGPIARL